MILHEFVDVSHEAVWVAVALKGAVGESGLYLLRELYNLAIGKGVQV